MAGYSGNQFWMKRRNRQSSLRGRGTSRPSLARSTLDVEQSGQQVVELLVNGNINYNFGNHGERFEEENIKRAKKKPETFSCPRPDQFKARFTQMRGSKQACVCSPKSSIRHLLSQIRNSCRVSVATLPGEPLNLPSNESNVPTFILMISTPNSIGRNG